jgi:hypothetical protein
MKPLTRKRWAHQSMSRVRTIACVLLGGLWMSVLSTSARAQCDFESFDAGSQYLSADDTATAITIYPAYRIIHRSDSCSTIYAVTEITCGGRRLMPAVWCKDSTWENWTDSELSNNTRSKVFPFTAGDTVSLYRSAEWRNHADNMQSPSNYHSDDTLDYVVELWRASTGARHAVIDSFGLLRRVTCGAPGIYGQQALRARLTYAIPPELTGDSGYVRIRVSAHGSERHRFVRHDHITGRKSDQLLEPATMAINEAYRRFYTPQAHLLPPRHQPASGTPTTAPPSTPE